MRLPLFVFSQRFPKTSFGTRREVFHGLDSCPAVVQTERRGKRSRPTLNRATNESERKTKMKRSCFCVAAVSVITITAAFQSVADASQDVGRLVNAPLWQIARVIESPCVGEIW